MIIKLDSLERVQDPFRKQDTNIFKWSRVPSNKKLLKQEMNNGTK